MVLRDHPHVHNSLTPPHPPGPSGGGEFWLAGRGPLLGHLAFPDAADAEATRPQAERPVVPAEREWVWSYYQYANYCFLIIVRIINMMHLLFLLVVVFLVLLVLVFVFIIAIAKPVQISKLAF